MRGAVALASAFAQQLPAHEACCEDEYEEDGPGRAKQHALAIIAQARARHKDVFELGRQLEQ
eukprot:6688112-Prymnesium_polylepis.1